MPLQVRKPYESFRKKLFHLLEPGSSPTGLSFFIDVLIAAVILINITSLIINTLPNLPTGIRQVLNWVEFYSVVFFSFEVILRWWVHVEHPKAKNYRFPRLYFFLTPFAVIDILAIAPFYLILFTHLNLKYLFLLRLFRLLKLVRYFKSLQLIGRVFATKSNELLISLFFTLTLLVSISFLIYYVEGPHQPDVFGSVPDAMWWGIVTLTTVGYGDVVPITVAGKILGGCIALLGVGLFALPAGILASGFSTELEKMTQEEAAKRNEAADTIQNKEWKYCPHCGKSIKDATH
ncbi:MAG: ion transporter [Schleiferiaceae bacterium]|nr:ion transporter [Schleiferiaceae bacterium]